jgi:hypothetical protein
MGLMFPDMHDWSLIGTEFVWAVGRISVRLESPEGGKMLVASEASSLQASRQHPWGPSVSVNSFNVQSNGERSQTARFEMQSGDIIVIEAAAFSME